MLKKSLVTKYLEECREIAGNEQIPIKFSRKEEEVTKYDPDRVQDYFLNEQNQEEISGNSCPKKSFNKIFQKTTIVYLMAF